MRIQRAVLTVASATAVLSAAVLLQLIAVPASSHDELVLVVVALALIVTAVSVIGSVAFARAIAELRAGILARARGEDSPMPSFSARELSELASAVERLSARATAREAELRQETADVRVVLNAVTDGIVQLDTAGRIVRTNPAADAMLGLSGSGIGQQITTLVRHVELRDLLTRSRGGSGTSAEITVDDRRLLVSARPLEGDAATPKGTVIAFTDLTELRRLEGVRRDFVANVSHELKTPLTSIRGYVETLITDPDLPDDVRRQFLEVVHKNADRLHHIVDDLLDLSRFESGGWNPHLEDIEVAPIIHDVVSACMAQAARRHIQIAVPDSRVHVRADPGALRQVLSNLLENSLRYTPEGGRIEIAVHGSARQNGNGRLHQSVAFEVRDNGPGIPSDALPRIFERFFRVDPARSRADGGTGLGLSIVKHLVESMGGDVSAASELGKGTAISFRLPAAR